MVSSTCSTASIESAPGGFPGFATDVAADVVTDGKHSMALIQRPYSVETGCGYGETNASMELQLLDALPLLSSSYSLWHHRTKNKKSTYPKLSSISRRGRYDSSFRLTPDFYPLPRWRPMRSRRTSTKFGDIDLRQLSENLKQFKRQNRRKSVIRFFDC